MGKPVWKLLRSKRRLAALARYEGERSFVCRIACSIFATLVLVGVIFVVVKWESLSEKFDKSWKEGVLEGMVGIIRQGQQQSTNGSQPLVPPASSAADSHADSPADSPADSARGQLLTGTGAPSAESEASQPPVVAPSNPDAASQEKTPNAAEDQGKNMPAKAPGEGGGGGAKVLFGRGEGEKIPDWAWLGSRATPPPPAWDAPWLEPACQKHVLGPPQPLAKPLRTIDDLIGPGQPKFTVSIPSNGFANSFGRAVPNLLLAKLTGRHYVMIHAGRSFGIFDHICHSSPPQAFECSPLQIQWQEERAAKDPKVSARDVETRLLHDILVPANIDKSDFAELRNLTDKVMMTRTFNVFAHKNGLRNCIKAMLGKENATQATLFNRAVNSVLGKKGPTPSLEIAMRNMLRKNSMDGSPPIPAGSEAGPDFQSATEAEFDISVHIRTFDPAIEDGTPDCSSPKCSEVRQNISESFLVPKVWECTLGLVDRRAKEIASLSKGGKGRGLAVFLSTDSVVLREEFVKRLSTYGTVFYSVGEVVNSGVHGETGHLETMGEWFLLGKAPLIISMGVRRGSSSQPSSFALSAARRGEASQVWAIDPTALRECSDMYTLQ